MLEFDNQTSLEVDLRLCTKIASKFTKKDIELLLVDASSIQNINLTYRNIDKPTDVLSFPIKQSKNTPLGSIVICSDLVEQKSSELSHSNSEEFTLLFIHGLLHLLGYDHEVDRGEMRQKEQSIIKEFGLPKSLIVRSEIP
ncbi:MAG: rRNA maturation RNase YbeY [Sulfuricurvum sp.]|jgi:probable rRNA maturation factor